MEKVRTFSIAFSASWTLLSGCFPPQQPKEGLKKQSESEREKTAQKGEMQAERVAVEAENELSEKD